MKDKVESLEEKPMDVNTDLTISQYINSTNVIKSIKTVLKDRTAQFTTSVISLASSNEKLKDCDKKSLLGACLTAASLNLPINQNLGFAYIIPYTDRKSGMTIAQFQMGYKGFIQLAQRSGQFKTINVSDVKEGEIKGINRLTGEIEFSWTEENRESLKTIGFVGYLKLTNGFEKSLYMTNEELKKHGVRFSQTMRKGYGLWVDDFDAMAKKTVIKLLLSKYAPLTTEMAKAQEVDQAVIEEDQIKYLDNKIETPDEISEEKERQRLIKYIKDCKTLEELEMCKDSLQDNEVFELYIEKEKELK